MAYKIKLKHVLSDLEDGDFKTKEELKGVLDEFKKEDFIEYFLNDFETEETGEVSSEVENDEDFA